MESDGRELNSDDGTGDINQAWASSMGKVMNIGNKRKTSKTVVLSKARKISELKTVKVDSEDTKKSEEKGNNLKKVNTIVFLIL